MRGSDGVRASVLDLLAWVRALDQGRVLAPDSLAQLYGSPGDDRVGFGWFWSVENERRWLWTRSYEDFGANAIVYRQAGSSLVLIEATNAGPSEEAGPGWSRVARDVLMEVYAASACTR